MTEVNMINCYKQRKRFFEKYGKDCNWLIAYLIMAGYVHPVNSVNQAYEEGHEMLRKLRHEWKQNPNRCNHWRLCEKGDQLDFVEFVDLHHTADVTLTNGMLKDEKGSLLLIDGDQLSSSTLELLCMELKYVACFTPTERSLRVFSSARNISLLLLQGCQSFKGIYFSFCSRNLTVLEISGSFDHIPHVIFSELTQLQFLKLSGMMGELHEECFSKLKQLRSLILRDCEELRILPTLQDLTNLEVLDLSDCYFLSEISSGIISSPKLQMVYLCGCHQLTSIPQLETSKLTHLFLRNLDLIAYTGIEIKQPSGLQVLDLKHPSGLQVLDLSCNVELERVDLSPHNDLIVLDLSGTKISSIDSVSDKVHLRKLILSGCESLRKLPTLEKLESLEVLDLSRTKVSCLPSFANPSRLLKLSLGRLTLDSLEKLTSLSSLVELDLSNAKINSSEKFEVGFVESFEKLQILNLSGTYVAELPRLAKLTSLKELLLENCEHLNTLPDLKFLTNIETLVLPVDCSTNIVLTKPSPVEEINDNHSNAQPHSNTDYVTGLEWLIRLIKQELKKTYRHDNSTVVESDSNAATTTTTPAMDVVPKASATATATGSNNEAYKRQLELLKVDVEYIRKHIDTLMNSSNSNRAAELLQPEDFEYPYSLNSSELQQLVPTFAKLKLMVPRIQTSGLERKLLHFTLKDKKTARNDVAKKWDLRKIPQAKMDQHLSSYETLTKNQKYCLLCFAAFNIEPKWTITISPLRYRYFWKSLEIRKRILIYWWVGEGFIDLDCEENGATEVSEEVALARRCKRKKTVEEIGEQILKVLTKKEFIEPVIEKGRETGRCRMHPLVHFFVIGQAKKDKFFDFSNKNGNLTTSFTLSRRACLLKSQDNFLSSCHRWEKWTQSSEKLKRFTIVRTLFNVDESIINIQPEWFSQMNDLSVLHLGNWQSRDAEHIEVGDQKFLENLKKMKQLKVFSLQGVSTLPKLPVTVCKVSSLLILDLRECHNLEELPVSIGSLKNLTHLDITNCHLLYKMPKGISSLLKLEVLKGFVICDQLGDPQDKKASILSHWWKTAKGYLKHDLLHFKDNEVCTLRDLLKLENLRKLSIVVNNKNFSDSEDLQVLKEMVNLRKLMISWKRSFKNDDKNVNRGQSGTDQGDNEAPGEDQGDIEALEEDQGDIETPEVDQEDDRSPEEGQGDDKALEDLSNTYGWRALCKEHASKSSSAEGAGPESQNVDGQEVLMGGKCLELMKYCMQQTNQKGREKKPRREFLDQIEKLELWCFPHETAPDWLVPNQLKNLQKLYIRGGKLRRLFGGTNGNKWKVKTLRLKYLPDLEISWTDLKAKFPQMTYLETYSCEKLIFSSCDEYGVWRVEYESP